MEEKEREREDDELAEDTKDKPKTEVKEPRESVAAFARRSRC
jgi:hypothetical protein